MSSPRVLILLVAAALLVTSTATAALATSHRPGVALQTTTGGGTAGGGQTGGGATAGGETTGGGATTAGGGAQEGAGAAGGEAEGELPGPDPSPGTTFAPENYETPWTWWMGVILTVVTVLGIGGVGLGYWLLVHRAGPARR
ncbi:MAG TPA: hypothetical protein VHF25_06130 [Nitriliruptorales bacterium]|nr:hypothetical protein [Nitriliruptorales bacterium]